MRFGRTLRESIYSPWKDQYIDYSKLKRLLREDGPEDEDKPWTEDDESRFCEELLNVQLEKVALFQDATFKSLEQRVAVTGDKLRLLAPEDGKGKAKEGENGSAYKEIEGELDNITNETKELKKYSNINVTASRKIAKKHDRKRGNRYRVKPMLQIALAKRPFNSEQAYTPLLNKLSLMFFVVRQNIEEGADLKLPGSEDLGITSEDGERYTAHKFFVHDDNLLEVKTYILRRLPALVYSQQSAKLVDASQADPTITSIYFDSPKFGLYTQKINNQIEGVGDARSLRLRWYGQLNDSPELMFEQKAVSANGTSEEKRFAIKDKYISSFIEGHYGMEKSVQKLERQGRPQSQVEEFKKNFDAVQSFIRENDLQPVLRANYSRTAFQKPLDNRVRISIDTQLAFIREDALDSDRPCRDPSEWHREDVDSAAMEYPFPGINKGEISKFPFSVLEIKVREDANKKPPKWIQDLMVSHLVHKAPQFSKFVYGVASLFEDQVNSLPSWLGEVEADIRKDPHTAFEQEEKEKAQRAEDGLIVGSFLGKSSSYKPAISSPLGKSYLGDRMAAEASHKSRAMSKGDRVNGSHEGRKSQSPEDSGYPGGYGTLSSVFPSFSLSRYAQSRRQNNVQLPPGVTKPGQLIKDSGPLQVEPKVWLANERTFLKWQHISVLLGGLAVGLYTAAGKDGLAEFMGIAYVSIAVFAGLWGYYMHSTRREMIIQRSGKDFDNLIGPMIISVALILALIINFMLKYRAALMRSDELRNGNNTDFISVY